MKRYETLASTLEAEIRSGTWSIGSRLPSVRHLRTQYGVGQSTVFRAYYLLEERGLISARERSGYFVAQGAFLSTLASSSSAPKEPEPAKIVSDLLFSVVEAARHPGIVPLGSGSPSPELFPLPRLAKSLARAARFLGPWSSVVDMPPGNEHLRRQIGLRYLGMGISQPIDEILVTNGAMEALNLCLMSVTKPGDIVAIESPCFYAALQAVERLGLRAIEIPVDPHTGLDLDVLANALERYPIRACWFMTNFHNPTGTTLTIEKKKTLVSLLTRHDVPLIEDDVFGELHFDTERPLPAKAFDTQGLVMHCTSLSKTLCPGYRIGWVTAGRYTDQVRKLKLMTSVATSIPVQAGIADYLQHGGFDKHLRKLRTSLRAQMASMEYAVAENLPPAVEYHKPAGGYFLWLKLPAQVNAMQLHLLALQRGVNVAPGSIFSSNDCYRNYVRVNCGHPWTSKIEGAVRTLGELLTRLADTGPSYAVFPSQKLSLKIDAEGCSSPVLER
ncbi:PLP-dependent aminotransferase family protein [Caballeronia sp. LjRoot34]|uniref:aminotransferase-like domain-containing protein n=1 Tax=Caballeronia sp. LjRoot34 TaxID=3342325 RepID=UPI003ECFB1B3